MIFTDIVKNYHLFYDYSKRHFICKIMVYGQKKTPKIYTKDVSNSSPWSVLIAFELLILSLVTDGLVYQTHRK